MAYIASNLAHTLYRASLYGTRWIDKSWGRNIGFLNISEYPKSGGTWLCRMVASIVDIPFPQHALLPLAVEAVLHNHFLYDKKVSRSIYLYRDGRDVLVSLYFHRMRAYANRAHLRSQRARNDMYDALFGKNFDVHDVAGNLPKFIENEMLHPMDAKRNWASHVSAWLEAKESPSVRFVAYEDLLTRPAQILDESLRHFYGDKIKNNNIELAVQRYSFENMTGRKRGTEDRSSFIRKAVPGDWKEYFTREAREVFHHYAGNELIALGYEKDPSWVCESLE